MTSRYYEIRVSGILPPEALVDFERLTATVEPVETVLHGPLVDQAALILLEHHWAVPLRDAIARAGGFRISDGFISPLDLVEIGLLSAEEAKDLHTMETASTGGA